MVKNVFISTGKKSVMHTLWVQTIVKRPAPEGAPIPAMMHYRYIKNLSMDEKVAIEEAKKYVAEHGGDFLGVQDSPLSKRAGFFDAFGVHFQQRRKHGKSFFMGIANSDFWEEWKKNKEQMKQAGFSVSLFSDPIKKRDVWYVFYRGGE